MGDVMKFGKVLVLCTAVLLSGCGYSAKDGEVVGQVKSVTHKTNLFCPDYDMVDISLGLMRNGVGSMSAQDISMTLGGDPGLLNLLKSAAESGKPVHIVYDTRRAAFCTEDYIARSATVEN